MAAGRVIGIGIIAVLLFRNGLGCSDDVPGGTEDGGPPLDRLPGGGAPEAGPDVASVILPDGAAGDIDLEVSVTGARGGALEVAVALSRDDGASFRPATVSRGAEPDAADRVRLIWHSLRDIGFRTHRPVILSFTVSDAQGPGPIAKFVTPVLDNLRAAAHNVDHYLANYGPFDDASIAIAQRYQMVIAHTRHPSLTPAQVASIQQGVRADDPVDDVLVLCYVSVGEDLRTSAFDDAAIGFDARFRGDGSGPRVDPRGPHADGASLDGVDPRGQASPGGTGYASFYLDDNDGNGVPDRNPIFGGLFVNAGDPRWFDTLDAMRVDGPDGVAGLREVLSSDYGRGLGCDGVFMDTVDTAAPNSFTNPSSRNPTEFEWTAPGMAEFIRHVRAAYPNKLILQNRGLFFFDPRFPHYEHNPRGAIDFVLYESYRLNSNPHEEWNAFHYPDNRYNVAPKLMAEAGRPDGFKVVSLGYAEGPADRMSRATLLEQSTMGIDSLMEDIRVTQDLAGFRHYITDGDVRLVNEFVRTHSNLEDSEPPRWASTYNDHDASPPVEPTARVGIQQAVGGRGQITVRWDVALDKSRVRYRLYVQPQPFDFQADPRLSGATRVELSPTIPAEYLKGVGPDRFPHEATLSGFPAGETQYLLIRAVDQSPAANEDTNTAVLTAAP